MQVVYLYSEILEISRLFICIQRSWRYPGCLITYIQRPWRSLCRLSIYIRRSWRFPGYLFVYRDPGDLLVAYLYTEILEIFRLFIYVHRPWRFPGSLLIYSRSIKNLLIFIRYSICLKTFLIIKPNFKPFIVQSENFIK